MKTPNFIEICHKWVNPLYKLSFKVRWDGIFVNGCQQFTPQRRRTFIWETALSLNMVKITLALVCVCFCQIAGLASHAVYTLYSVHSYWWKRQVSHQLWPSGSQHTSKKECRREIHSGFETHEEGHTKSKTGAISGSTKWTFVQKKI